MVSFGPPFSCRIRMDFSSMSDFLNHSLAAASKSGAIENFSGSEDFINKKAPLILSFFEFIWGVNDGFDRAQAAHLVNNAVNGIHSGRIRFVGFRYNE